MPRKLSSKEPGQQSIAGPLVSGAFLLSASLFFLTGAPSWAGVAKTSKTKVIEVVHERHAAHQNDRFSETPAPRAKPMPRGGAYAPLNSADIKRYREIFALQKKGAWESADPLLEQLSDLRLRGHVLHQRLMHPTAYRSSYHELKTWLDLYGDHPGADRVYRLALKRRPADAAGPLRPESRPGISGALEVFGQDGHEYVTGLQRSRVAREDVRLMTRNIRRALSQGGPTRAWNHLNNDSGARYIDHTEFDILRSQIALGYLHAGKIAEARKFAEASLNRSGAAVPLAGWVAGLSAWKQGDFKQAAAHFEITADADSPSAWTIAAAAYWAGRSHLRAGHYDQVSPWLKKAASYPRTFYGLIATRALGLSHEFNWDVPDFGAAEMRAVARVPGARRAMALLEVGQRSRAEQELRQIHPGSDQGLRDALIALGTAKGLPAFSMRFASAVPNAQGSLYDAALYPVAPWAPERGYHIDRALIYAFIRQESRFDPHAENNSGATGLMQLMPDTANYVAGRKIYSDHYGRRLLKDPLVNLGLGQSYIANLLQRSYIDGNLFKLVIAYNAGPGNLQRWWRRLEFAHNDALLFIESIPVAETRAFAERVLTNFWIYRLRLGQPVPSLDTVVEGDWPRYSPLDEEAMRVADIKQGAEAQ